MKTTRTILSIAVLAFVPAVAAAQTNVTAQQKPAPAKRQTQAAAKSRPCLNQADKQTCERGWQLLDAGEAEASGLQESGVRAYAQLLVARAYANKNKTRAIKLLNRAFTSTLGMPDGNKEAVQGRIEATEKADLQRQTLESLVTLAPEEAEEKLSMALPSVREPVFAVLVGYYQKTKRFDAAIDRVNQIARDAGFPYMAASRLIAVLPPDKVIERQQLFANALNSFKTNPPARNAFGWDSAAAFPELIVRHWKELPVGLVREAIDEVLKQADPNRDGEQPIYVTVRYGGAGTAALSSMYDYRLFQLLPVLRQIAPDSAESLLRDHESVSKQFDAYVGAGSPSIRYVQGGPSNATGRPVRYQVRAPAPGASPQEVVAAIMAVDNVGARANFLLATARREQFGNPSTAKACLDKLVDTVAVQLPSASEEVSILVDSATLYLDVKETGGATKAISTAQAAADKLYAVDDDSSDPNKALKAYWPSTRAYLRLVRLAGRVSPNLALTMIKEMRDEEIRPLMRLALAGSWIGLPVGRFTVIYKDGGSTQNNAER